MKEHDESQSQLNLTRRALLRTGGLGIGAMALSTLMPRDLHAAGAGRDPLASRKGHFPARAKRVIYLHMAGAPSQLDLFDHKPSLNKHHGELIPEEVIKGQRFAFIQGKPRLMGSQYAFSQHGQSGAEISTLMPHLAGIADQLTFIKSMHTDEFNHGPAELLMKTGFGRFGRPSIGAWATYGIGSESRDLPAFVVMNSGTGMDTVGNALWGSGFLPSVHQGVEFRTSGDPVPALSNPDEVDVVARRRSLEAIKDLNRMQLASFGDPEIATRIAAYEMAFRMQSSVPDLVDIGRESKATLELYGAQADQPSFARNCLLARRLVERGVRFVQIHHRNWDNHVDLPKQLPLLCQETDQAVAALVKDLAARGLLDDTLVIWGGEFGRTPMQENRFGDRDAGGKLPGRDHHPRAFTVWLAGGGTKPGLTFGKTDDLGYNVVEDPVHVHDLNATILHLLGLDHERLTFRFQGRDFRLTDVHGTVVKKILKA